MNREVAIFKDIPELLKGLELPLPKNPHFQIRRFEDAFAEKTEGVKVTAIGILAGIAFAKAIFRGYEERGIVDFSMEYLPLL